MPNWFWNLKRKIYLLENQLMFGNISQAGRICSSLGCVVSSVNVVLTACKQGTRLSTKIQGRKSNVTILLVCYKLLRIFHQSYSSFLHSHLTVWRWLAILPTICFQDLEIVKYNIVFFRLSINASITDGTLVVVKK